MTAQDPKTEELLAEAQRLQELLSAAVGELGAFVQQLRQVTHQAREDGCHG